MNLHVRSATLDDENAIASLLNTYLLAYFGRPLAPGEAYDRLTRPDSNPTLVEDAAGAVVGFGHAWRAGSVVRCYAKVHPDAIGQGVGGALLSHLEQWAGTLGASAVNLMHQVTDTAAPALLTGRGYTEICHVLRMRVDLENYEPQTAPVPAGVDIAGFRHERDALQLFEAFQEAFPDDPAGEAEWWHERCENPAMPFDPALWFAARKDDEIVGFCLGSRKDEGQGAVGYVSDIGVRPSQRGRGIAFALLTTTLAAFAAGGLSTATLNVDADNLTGALRLYRKAGMHPKPLSIEWSKPLPG